MFLSHLQQRSRVVGEGAGANVYVPAHGHEGAKARGHGASEHKGMEA